ncbi:uncharacterized [Tachysurus ichikawai]
MKSWQLLAAAGDEDDDALQVRHQSTSALAHEQWNSSRRKRRSRRDVRASAVWTRPVDRVYFVRVRELERITVMVNAAVPLMGECRPAAQIRARAGFST